MLEYFYNKYKMFCTIVSIAMIASLQLPEAEGRTPEGDESLIPRSLTLGGEVPCGIRGLDTKYWESCKRTYLVHIFPNEISNDVITGQKLLKRIAAACSHYNSYRVCANCTAKHDCPEQRALLFETLIGKWSVFCEKDQVSDWLQTILQNGFSYNESCEGVIRRQFSDCYYKVFMEIPFNYTAYRLMSLSEGIDYFRSIVSARFQCSIGAVLEISEYLRQECGTTWQDVLLTKWLINSAFTGVGNNINQEEVQILQDMRC